MLNKYPSSFSVVYREQGPASIPWVRTMLGDEPLHLLVYEVDRDVKGAELRRVRKLFPEARILGWPSSNGYHLPEGVEQFPDDS
jgi:hypothetical protein